MLVGLSIGHDSKPFGIAPKSNYILASIWVEHFHHQISESMGEQTLWDFHLVMWAADIRIYIASSQVESK